MFLDELLTLFLLIVYFWLCFLFLLFFLLELELLSIDFCLFISSPKSKMVKDYSCSHSYIQTRSLLSVLRNIHEEIAHLLMNR